MAAERELLAAGGGSEVGRREDGAKASREKFKIQIALHD